ncbi:MAG: hypothetical protein ABJB33_05855 [Gemmatimonadota bacterium]
MSDNSMGREPWMGLPPNLEGLPPKGPRPTAVGQLVYWLKLRRDVLASAARRPGAWWRWWREGADWYEAYHMGWPLAALAARRSEVQAWLAEEDANERQRAGAAWAALSPVEQARCHERLHAFLAAGEDPMWLTAAERHLYNRAVLIPDELGRHHDPDPPADPRQV